MRALVAAGLIAAFLMLGGRAGASADVQSRRLVLEAPTLLCLGVRWYISGDDNEDASVTVEYRRKGERAWHAALPLRRVGAGPEDG
jgi:hypothetical protein